MASSTTNRIANLHRPLVLGPGAPALVRPLARILTGQAGWAGPAVLPIVLTLAITLVGRRSHLRGVVDPAQRRALPDPDGELQGPLATPISLLPLLLINAAWGALCGLLTLVVRRVRA